MPAHSYPRLLTLGLILLLLLDISLPISVGLLPGAGCANCSLTDVLSYWPLTPQGSLPPYYYLGESSFDLFCMASARGLLFLCLLCRLRSYHASARPTNTPLLQPLQLGVAPSDSSSPPPPPRLLGVLSSAARGITLLHCSLKGFARLLQSGDSKGAGFGLLLQAGSTPPPLEFWVLVIGALLISQGEGTIFSLLHGKRKPTGGFSEAPSRKGKASSEEEEAADSANLVKQAYLKRTSPGRRETKSLRYCAGLMRADWKLLLLAYVSLIFAAAGESSVPLLYGKVAADLDRQSSILHLIYT